jgi:hypothetical protein
MSYSQPDSGAFAPVNQATVGQQSDEPAANGTVAGPRPGSASPLIRSAAGFVAEHLGKFMSAASALTWAVAGGTLMVLGSFMPLIYQPNASLLTAVQVKSGLSQASCVLGILLIGSALAARYQASLRMPAAATSLGLSLLSLAGYGLFTLAGIVGVQMDVGFGLTERVSWYPNIGMLALITGCAANGLAAALILSQQLQWQGTKHGTT